MSWQRALARAGRPPERIAGVLRPHTVRKRVFANSRSPGLRVIDSRSHQPGRRFKANSIAYFNLAARSDYAASWWTRHVARAVHTPVRVSDRVEAGHCSQHTMAAGGMRERPNRTVSKTVVSYGHRGFKSHSLRQGVLTKVRSPRLRNPSPQALHRLRRGFVVVGSFLGSTIRWPLTLVRPGGASGWRFVPGRGSTLSPPA